MGFYVIAIYSLYGSIYGKKDNEKQEISTFSRKAFDNLNIYKNLLCNMIYSSKNWNTVFYIGKHYE